jgi:hypothetical protein
MDKPQIETALNRLFHDQGKRIVFWNDPQREFEDTLAALAVPDIKVVRLDQDGALAVKIRVEREDPTGRYLIYAPTPEPDYDDDWLLDIRLYSHTFRADRASIILDELGLANQALRSHVEERKKFFDNKERFKKIQALVSPQDTEIDLDRKMLAVLVKADQPDPFTIVLALFHSLTRAALSTGGCAESKFLSLSLHWFITCSHAHQIHPSVRRWAPPGSPRVQFGRQLARRHESPCSVLRP